MQSSSQTLETSNAKLKETIVRLEATIARMELSHRAEINAHQEVIQNYRDKNMDLHDQVFSLKQSQNDYDRKCEDIVVYEEIINQLQKENVQLHYKVDVLTSSRMEDLFHENPEYLSSSLEESLSQSPSLKEMTNRSHSENNAKAQPFSQRVMQHIHYDVLRKDVMRKR